MILSSIGQSCILFHVICWIFLLYGPYAYFTRLWFKMFLQLFNCCFRSATRTPSGCYSVPVRAGVVAVKSRTTPSSLNTRSTVYDAIVIQIRNLQIYSSMCTLMADLRGTSVSMPMTWIRVMYRWIGWETCREVWYAHVAMRTVWWPPVYSADNTAVCRARHEWQALVSTLGTAGMESFTGYVHDNNLQWDWTPVQKSYQMRPLKFSTAWP